MVFLSVFLLLKYFYPGGNQVVPIVSKDAIVDLQTTNNDATTTSVINEKTNLVLSDIENGTYLVGQSEIVFVDGVGHTKINESSAIKLVAFGDVNSDGNGDAIVVISTNEASTSPISRNDFFVILNKNGLAKSILFNPPLEDNVFIKNYKKLDITNGKIILDIEFSLNAEDDNFNNWKAKHLEYIFANNNYLIKYENKVSWKKYKNTEFGFELLYPEKTVLEVRPLSDGTRNILNSLFVSVPLPFVTKYNTWTEKGLSLFIKKNTCPYRNASMVMQKNGIDFHIYEPQSSETSNTDVVSKLVEYMTYRNGYCFTIVTKLEGPGPLSPKFPKTADAKSPQNIENFFGLEFILLNQVLDTFKFL